MMLNDDKPSALFISEKTLLSARLIIRNEPNRVISPETLINYQYGDMTEGNARQSLSSLRKMGILDESNLPTDLGRKWANPDTRIEATESIAIALFPDGACDAIQHMNNKEFASWLIERKPMTENIALKNASTLRILLRLCQDEPTSETNNRHDENICPRDNRSNTQQAVIKVSAKAGKSVLREVFELAKETGLTVIIE